MMDAQHLLVEHVGEVEIEIEASTLEALFEEAARALAEVMTEEKEKAHGSGEEVLLEASDREALLADWLNELIYLSETRKLIYADVDVDGISDRALHAHVRGFAPRHLKTPVKAATLHGLRVIDANGGFTARVVLDV